MREDYLQPTAYASAKRGRVYTRAAVIERFQTKVVYAPSGCWEWVGSRSVKGYGQFHLNTRQRTYRAHRVSYELFVDAIPEGLQIDHLCRNRGCVNPAHLQPVEAHVNQARGLTVSRRLAERTHCNHGHPLTEDNVAWVVKPGRRPKRRCKECHRIESRERARRKKAACA